MPRLFDVNSITPDALDLDNLESGAISITNDEGVILGKTSETVEQVFHKLDLTKTSHYVSCGDWSNHELLHFILTKIGPADVMLATWSMSEPSAVKLMGMLKTGLCKRLTGVLDFRTKNRHPSAFQLSQTLFADLKLTSCHAKVTVISNEKHNISIIGSANYTNNPRIEAGVISTLQKSG